MTRLADIILEHPISTGWLHGLLMFIFALHFLFVLLTIGTALLATVYYTAGQWGASSALRGWDRDLLAIFFAHKSVAIVLGVGPILLMQVGHSIPFLTGINAISPLWMFIILALLGSLGLYEWQHRRRREHPWGYLVVSVLALLLLCYVPATFVAALVATERPAAWAAMLKLGGQLPREASVHWLFRLLHVFGASVVVTAALHYVWPEEDQQRRRHLLGWMSGGLAFQFLGGVALYGTVRPFPSALATGSVLVGVAAAALLAFLSSSWRHRQAPGGILTGLLVSLIIVPMLLTRQVLQDRILRPLGDDLRKNALIHKQALAPHAGQALAAFEATLAVPYDNALAMYTRSCSICHGAVGNGQGDAAGNLLVRPEDLSSLRVTDAKLDTTLQHGVEGSAMPVFDFYLESELDLLRSFLRDRVGLHRRVEPVEHTIPDSAVKEARQLFDGTCSVCHDKDGKGSATGLAFRPPVPDLTQLSATPAYDFRVLTEGYPGTMMRPFSSVSEDVRWAAVRLVQGFYTGGTAEPAPASPEGGR